MNATKLNPIFATQGSAKVSPKYGFANSNAILETFKAQGWTVDSTQIAKVRNEADNGYQKHLVLLSNPNLPRIAGLSADNESSVRLCLLNSHNASTSLQVFLGVLRIACLNGIIAGKGFRYFRAVHSANIIERLQQGISYVTQGVPELVQNVQYLQSVQLNIEHRIQLARLVLPARFENVGGLLGYDLTCVERALRTADTAQDAYTVANRLQEYLIRGGIPYSYTRNVKDLNGNIIDQKIVHTRTKLVSSIGTQIKLNEALFAGIKQVLA